MKRKLKTVPETAALKLDFGCGPNKRESFLGVDAMQFDGKVDIVLNLVERVPFVGTDLMEYHKWSQNPTFKPWPWADGSVSEAHCSHFIEHLDWNERVHFFNELHRVLAKEGSCQIILPHWGSERYYGDPTHKSAMSEFAFYYLDRDWRKVNAPHTGYTCHLGVTWAHNLRQDLTFRNQEYQMFALANFKGAAQDIVGTIKAKK